jgi:hypothetical protein
MGTQPPLGLCHPAGKLRIVDPLPSRERRHRLPAGPMPLHRLETTLRRRHPPATRIALLTRLHHIGPDRTHPRQISQLRPR